MINVYTPLAQVLLHTWPPLMRVMRTMLSIVTLPSHGKESDSKQLSQSAPSSRTKVIDRTLTPAPTPTAASARMLAAAPSESVGKDRHRNEGLNAARLVLRARCIAPLHRLFQSWLQQLYQLLMKFGHLEVGCIYVHNVSAHGVCCNAGCV